MKLNIILHEIEGEGYLCIKLADLTVLKRQRKTFKPPTIEEVKEYCKERKNGIDVIKWWNFYNSKGWMIGKNKMKDWQSAVITWEEDKPELKGSNLGDAPPEFFGMRSPNANQMPQVLKDKYGIK